MPADEKPFQRPTENASWGLTLNLDLHTGGVDLGITDVFQRMRWQRLLPCRRIEFRSLQTLPVVHQDVSKMVAPNAIAPTLDEDHARPAMSVDGSRPSGRNARLQYTHLFVFKQKCVVAGCGDHGIQRLRPWPPLFRCARRLRHLSLSAFACRSSTPGLWRTDAKNFILGCGLPYRRWDSPGNQRLQGDAARNAAR